MSNTTGDKGWADDIELKKKIRKVFAYRTHKFPDKKVEIIQTPETQNQRFILAPYEATVEKLAAQFTNLLETERQRVLSEVEAGLPEKLDYPESWAVLRPEHKQQYDAHNEVVAQTLAVIERLKK